MSDEEPGKISKKKILLAEDDDSMRRFVEVVLRQANYEVISTEDGLAGMKAAFENEIDAVAADAVMPNMTGYDLCRVLRQNLAKKDVPFIILSGFDQNNEINSDNCLADAYLVKEKNLKELLIETLSNILAEKATI